MSSSRGSPTDSSAHAPSSSSSSAGGSQRHANTTHEAEHLSRLLLGSVGTIAGHMPSGVDIGAMLNSVRWSTDFVRAVPLLTCSTARAQLQYSDATTEQAPLPQLAEPNLSLSRPSPETFNNIFQIMPTRHQAAQAVLFYFARCDTLHVIYRPRFDAQCLAFWETGSVPDPHWLATFLCVTANGLLAMGDDEAAQCQMPIGDGRGLLARSWLDGALKALFSGGERSCRGSSGPRNSSGTARRLPQDAVARSDPGRRASQPVLGDVAGWQAPRLRHELQHKRDRRRLRARPRASRFCLYFTQANKGYFRSTATRTSFSTSSAPSKQRSADASSGACSRSTRKCRRLRAEAKTEC